MRNDARKVCRTYLAASKDPAFSCAVQGNPVSDWVLWDSGEDPASYAPLHESGVSMGWRNGNRAVRKTAPCVY